MNKDIKKSREVSATEENEIAKNIFKVAPGVWRLKDVFVNVYIIQSGDGADWALVDAGFKTSSVEKIKNMIVEVFGRASKPCSIIMTHGHFDHRGALKQLANEWRVPVYIHHLEAPYLSGKSAYPPADTSVGGGLMSSLAFAYPTKPIDVEEHLKELPDDNTLPKLDGWKWMHTPGHTPGHISLFRERDGVLIAGDAIVTTQQESAISVITQKKKVSGPPKYLTPDWGAAARSVKDIAALKPNIIATGHGQAMYGDEARAGLKRLSRDFWHKGIPQTGRYVSEPALFNDEGPTYVPPTKNNYLWLRIIGATTMVIVGYYLFNKTKQKTLGKTLLAGSVSMLTTPIPEI